MNELEQLRKLLNLIETDLSVPSLKKEIRAEVTKSNDFKVLDRVYQVFSHTGLKDKIENALSNTLEGANVGQSIETVTKDIATVIKNLSGSSGEKLQFINDLEKDKAVNTTALLKTFSTFEEIFSSKFAIKFFREMDNYGRGSNMKGPGEFALAIMSGEISLANKGDLKIGSKLVEVKAATKMDGKGGRLGETGSLSTAEIRQTLEDGFKKFIKSPEAVNQAMLQFFGKAKSKSIVLGVATLHKIFPDNPNAVETIIKDILTKSFGASFAGKVAKAAANDTSGKESEISYMEENFKHYKEEGGFDVILGITFGNGRTYTITDAKSIGELRRKGILGAASINLIPGKANEIYSQLNFSKRLTGEEPDSELSISPTKTNTKRKSKADIKANNRESDLAQKQADFKASKGSRDPEDRALYGRDKADNWFNDRFK